MKIQVLSVQIATVPTARGSYQVADVAYKNLTFQGKVEGKKIMSFGATADAFATLATAQPNDTFEVNVVKNSKGYNDWVSMEKAVANANDSAISGAPERNKSYSQARTSTFETPEERAKKQVYIIRQSSLTNAIASLSVGAKAPLKAADVIAEATKYQEWVLGTENKFSSKETDFPAGDFPDMPQ